jgi:hypothetical protein
MNGIRRAVLKVGIALPPYLWWQRARFQKWRNWGADGSWVPGQRLVRFPDLREVVLLLEGKVHQEMLPVEWRVRCVRLWGEELEKVRGRWPKEWRGEMPVLRILTRLDAL